MTAQRPMQEEDLHAYIDGALDDAARERVEDYLALHPDAAERVARLAQQRDALRAAFAPIAQEPVPPELNLARMVESRRRGWAANQASWRKVASIAALAFALGGLGGWAGRGMSGPAADGAGGGLAALAQEASASYQVYASDTLRPVEFGAADQEGLVRWVSDRLHRRIAVPDLRQAGYRYMGGRLVATSHGPAGLFMYDDSHGGRVAMLVRPMQTEGDAPMRAHAQDGVAGYSWADQGLGYSLVASAVTPGLHPLADEMRRQIDHIAD